MFFFRKKKPALLAVGEPAPDFEVPDQDGRVVKLSDFSGQRLLIWFYPKASTPGCTAEGKGFRDRVAKIRLAGKIVGVSFDAPEANKAFQEKHGFPFPLLCDTTRAMGLAYRACASAKAWYPDRVTYVVDANGKIEYAERVKDIPAHVDAATARLCNF